MSLYESYRKTMEELKLPLNPEFWTPEQEAIWNEAMDKLDFSVKAPEADEDFFLIKSTLHKADGSTQEVVTDVRELTLDQLKQVTSVMPKYIRYYYERLAQKESE